MSTVKAVFIFHPLHFHKHVSILNFSGAGSLTRLEFHCARVRLDEPGLVPHGFDGFFRSGSPSVLNVIIGNKLIFYGLMIAQVGLVFYLSSALMRLSAETATALFLAYSILMGLTLSVIFLIYTTGSIASTFLITAGIFGIMSAYGFYTKKDLTSIGNLCFMGLIGIILASIVNIFWQNGTFYWITTCIGVLVFVGLTAYDTQKIKMLNATQVEGADNGQQKAIYGALTLYLDFINLFLMLLRLLGSRRN